MKDHKTLEALRRITRQPKPPQRVACTRCGKHVPETREHCPICLEPLRRQQDETRSY